LLAAVYDENRMASLPQLSMHAQLERLKAASFWPFQLHEVDDATKPDNHAVWPASQALQLKADGA
jgi:hypothetical protein